MNLLERLTYENQILQRDGMSQFTVYVNGGSYYLWGEHRTNRGNSYVIWSPLPSDFPFSCPPLYIYLPNPLWGFRSLQTINSYGISHAMHTLANGPNGEVQICHWRSANWHSGITLNRVLLKGMLWLEAYEQHVDTGVGIHEFVRTMQ